MKNILIAMLCIMLLSGCVNIKESQQNIQSESIVMKTMNIPESDFWKYEVAERLYDEFRYFYDNMEECEIIDMAKNSHNYVNRNTVGYNCVMAIDRGCGISQVYYKYLSDEKVDDVRNKMFDLGYVDYFSGVRFGYMENGMHFMVIYPENWDYAKVDDNAKNKIRNLNDEMDFYMSFTMKQIIF